MHLPSMDLSPTARRVLAAAIVVGGVALVGGQLRGTVPRDVEVGSPGTELEFAL